MDSSFRPRMPSFSGVSGDDFASFWVEVDIFFRASGFVLASVADDAGVKAKEDAKAAALVASMMVGPAKQWFLGMEDAARASALASAGSLRVAVSTKFKPFNASMDARSALARLRLSEFKSFDEFALAFSQVARRADADFSRSELLHHLCGALPESVAEALLLQEPADLAAALAFSAKKLSAADAAARMARDRAVPSASARAVVSAVEPHSFSAATVAASGPPEDRIAALERKLDAILSRTATAQSGRVGAPRAQSPMNRVDSEGNRVCNNCGSPGHFARGCRVRATGTATTAPGASGRPGVASTPGAAQNF